ncbi:hypothetical protein BDQ17DRAFT_855707 [Cyathus striatus]|nr:hypothetical protein BDQ17DRAFT_855707 [Cyathus striatus]
MSSVSSFFSRDASLKRQARTFRARKHSKSTSLFSSPSPLKHQLHIIQEEDERANSSSSSCPSPSPTRSSYSRSSSPLKKRHASISAADICIVQRAEEEIDDDMLLLSPRPAPRPPRTPSPQSSPDSFRLTFTDVAFTFPHPPIPTPSCASPTPSMCSSSSMSSPGSDTMGLPTTPGSSDDEFTLSSPRIRRRARGVEIKPLVIVKHRTSRIPTQGEDDETPAPQSSSEEDEESDGEWFASEFSKILSLCEDAPVPSGPARPESMALPPSLSLPPTPPPVKRRRSRSNSVRAPPPPVPPIPAHFRSQSTTTIGTVVEDAEFRMSIPPRPLPTIPTIVEPLPSLTEAIRPPPKSAVPEDEQDALSEFSLSLYVEEEAEVESVEVSTPSVYSQFSAEGEGEIEVDIDFDAQLMLPLSLPGSPIDFEKDVVWEVRRRLGEVDSIVDVPVEVPVEVLVERKVEVVDIPEVIVDEVPEEDEQRKKRKEKRRPIQLTDVFVPSPCSSSLPRSPSPDRMSYALSPSPSHSRYSPSPSSTSSSPSGRYNSRFHPRFSPTPSTSSFASSNDSSFSSFSYPESAASLPTNQAVPQQVLRSKWSSSTLGSVREPAEPSTARKLRAFLGARSSLGSPKSSPEKAGRASGSASGSGSPKGRSGAWGAAAGATRQWNDTARRHSRRDTGVSEGVMVIGFNQPQSPSPTRQQHSPFRQYSPGYAQQGLKRRGSTMSNASDATVASSADSCASSGGLRRKPIPVEMFLRA